MDTLEELVKGLTPDERWLVLWIYDGPDGERNVEHISRAAHYTAKRESKGLTAWMEIEMGSGRTIRHYRLTDLGRAVAARLKETEQR